MRVLSFIAIALGIYLLASAGYDELRGVTRKPVTLLSLKRRFNTSYLYSIPVQRQQNPELFRRFMLTHWIYAIVIEGVGCVLYLNSKPEKGM